MNGMHDGQFQPDVEKLFSSFGVQTHQPSKWIFVVSGYATIRPLTRSVGFATRNEGNKMLAGATE
jgi:hypothetical protein